MKVKVINLYSAKDRRYQVDRELKPLGIDYTYYEASRNCSPWGYQPLTAAELGHLSVFKSLFGRHIELSPGEMGCASSHLRILHDFVESGEDWICVLEDDIKVERPDVFKAIIEEKISLPTGMDFVYLGAYRRTIPQSMIEHLRARIKGVLRSIYRIKLIWQSPSSSIDFHYQSVRETFGYAKRLNKEWCVAGIHDGTHAYVLNQRAAREIIKWNGNLNCRADEILSFLSYDQKVRMAISVDPIVLQNLALPSQIGNNPQARSL